MSVELLLLRCAAASMRARAGAATAGTWTLCAASEEYDDYGYGGEVRSPTLGEDGVYDDLVASIVDYSDTPHIASWHPAVALAVADWLDAVAAVHWPKRHETRTESHYSAEPEHDYIDVPCVESCWREAYICNGCGTAECEPEILGAALAVARVYLGEQA